LGGKLWPPRRCAQERVGCLSLYHGTMTYFGIFAKLIKWSAFSKQKNHSNCGRYYRDSPPFVYLRWHWKAKTTNIDTVNLIYVELKFWVAAWPRIQGVGFLGRSWWPYDAGVHMDAEAITENMFSWTVVMWRCHSCCLGILACRNSPPLYAHVNMESYILSLK
jgi:hypothetical protein